MQTDALEHAKHAAETGPHERLSWGIIEIQVTNLDRAVDFWTQAFGISVRNQDGETAELGTQKKTLVVLRSGATKQVRPQHLGMYHVAIALPDQLEFSRILARLITKGVRISPTDHLASKSIYFSDPDGLEIEIVYETPKRFGRFGDLTNGLIMLDVDGDPHSGREPLNVEAELVHAQGADLEAPLTDGAYLGHLHLKVPALKPAAAWFEGIGFARGLMLPVMGFADMGAGGTTTHRLAMNIWAGPHLQPAPSDMARLVRYALHIHDPAIIKHAKGLQPTGTGLIGRDPTGTEISLIPVC